MNKHGATALALSDDTVEIQLTPEELLGLTEAAESAQLLQAAATRSPLVDAPAPLHLASRTIGPDMRSGAFAIITFAVFVWWSVDHVFGQQAPPVARPAPAPVMAAGGAGVNISQPQPPGTSADPVVKVRNPFDATEVFEFPAGTSRAESRQKVAQLLLQRARDRAANP